MDTYTLELARELARLADQREDWQDLALCAQTDPDSFFPEKGESPRPAKRACAACEVRAECLQYALDHGERFGVWVGLSERERRALARQPSPVRHCPTHGEELSGGPVLYHCPAGRLGHSVTAADLQEAAEAAMLRRPAALPPEGTTVPSSWPGSWTCSSGSSTALPPPA